MRASFASLTLKIRFRRDFRARSALAAGIVTFISCTGFAQSLVDLGIGSPVQGTYDLAQLGTNGNQDFPDGLNYYTDKVPRRL